MKRGLFWSLHRGVQVLFWTGWAAVAVYLFSQRAALQPAIDYLELWWNQPAERPGELPRLSGLVTRIYAGDSFQLRDDQGGHYNYGLAGVAVPKAGPNSTPAERLVAGSSLTNLTKLIQGERVEIQVTLANPQTRTGVGLVRSRGMNLNESVLASGSATLKREQIRMLPLREQWGLVRAERLAQRRQLGIWATPGNARPESDRPR